MVPLFLMVKAKRVAKDVHPYKKGMVFQHE